MTGTEVTAAVTAANDTDIHQEQARDHEKQDSTTTNGSSTSGTNDSDSYTTPQQSSTTNSVATQLTGTPPSTVNGRSRPDSEYTPAALKQKSKRQKQTHETGRRAVPKFPSQTHTRDGTHVWSVGDTRVKRSSEEKAPQPGSRGGLTQEADAKRGQHGRFARHTRSYRKKGKELLSRQIRHRNQHAKRELGRPEA